MQLINFPLESINKELPAVQLDDGSWLFSAQEVCFFAEVASKVNASKWVRNNIPAKWTIELKTKEGNGRPGLYLTKPGFFFAVCQGKSELALKFRDEVFEVILPKIDASGGYIMPTATSEQLEALQLEIKQLQAAIKDKDQRGQTLYKESVQVDKNFWASYISSCITGHLMKRFRDSEKLNKYSYLSNRETESLKAMFFERFGIIVQIERDCMFTMKVPPRELSFHEYWND